MTALYPTRHFRTRSLRRRSLAHALKQNAFHIPRAATVSRESLVRPARVHRRRRSTIEGTLLLRRGPRSTNPPVSVMITRLFLVIGVFVLGSEAASFTSRSDLKTAVDSCLDSN